MEKISIINRNTIAKRFRTYLTLGLISLSTYYGVDISKTFTQHLKYVYRRESVERLIHDGKLNEAESILDVLDKEDGLEKPDLEVLGTTLNALKKDKKVKELDNLINAENYDRAKAKYLELVNEGILSEDQLRYSNRVNQISLEGRLRAVQQTAGRERIDSIEKLISNYPDYEKADELRTQQISEYTPLIISFFKANIEEELPLLLKGFNSSLRQLKTSKLSGFSFDELVEEGDKYFTRLVDNDPRIFIGDNVETINKLGEFNASNGRTKNDYFNASNKIPLHSLGIVTWTDKSRMGSIKVKFRDGKEDWFTEREVKRMQNSDERKEALEWFLEIKNYLKDAQTLEAKDEP